MAPLICLDEETHIQKQQEREMKGLSNYGELKRSLKYAVVHKHLYTLVRYTAKSPDADTFTATQTLEIITNTEINPVNHSNREKAQFDTLLIQNIVTAKKNNTDSNKNKIK